MKIGIITYGAGNVASVQNALDRLGVKSLISDDRKVLEGCDKLIFPGVGHAAHAMENLSRKGLDKLLQDFNRPVLGICLGMQLMGSESEEGPTKGLGLIDFRVKRFEINEKVPHMGWNSIEKIDHPLLGGIESGSHFYFVHGYYAELSKETIASSQYEIPFSVAVASGNYFGVQFHPEKSGDAGAKLLKNFINL
ncbi:MAG: imidazole glycerol phosphate synthase subunit HisH [Bacteroidales bacterium]|nr:imidazole glycerol phosphate synthase subunit HisH [Bacteroidales bacterium]